MVTDDLKQATVLRPVINVCACLNLGRCVSADENILNDSANSTDERFNLLRCACVNGYTGAFCEKNLDACEENSQPCYPGVKCRDLPPPANESGFECGLCPVGLTGNGADCAGLQFFGGLAIATIFFLPLYY